MKQITEDYCSYKVSKLLKEKEFPMIDHSFMYVNKDNIFMTDDYASLKLSLEEYKHFDDVYIPTVTHQMAMKWLREKHGLTIAVVPTMIDEDPTVCYVADIWVNEAFETITQSFVGDTYEAAVEVAIEYSLENLMKYTNTKDVKFFTS